MKIFCGYKNKEGGRWWFRIFGYGIVFKDTKRHKLLFSERYGYSGFKIGKWFFKILTPNSI